MRRLAALLLMLAAAAAAAQQPAAPAPQRNGYAFDQPRILAQQRLFGLAHGVSLLVSACMDLPTQLDAAVAAYAPWRERHEAVIAQAQAELARHYFGTQAADAVWPDLVAALKLKNRLALAADSAELQAACETLAAALAKPRYDLAALLRDHGRLAEAAAGVETELRAAFCRDKLPEAERPLFDTRLEVWREINADRLSAAEAALRREWPAEGPAESLDAWLAQLRRDVRVRGSAEGCREFSAWLRTPSSALRQIFAPPPETLP